MTTKIQKPLLKIIIPSLALIILLFFISAFVSDIFDEGNRTITDTGLAEEVTATVASENDSPDAEETTLHRMPIYGDWQVFTTEDGLPSNKVNTVKIDEGRILVGTDRGLAVLENNEWTIYTPEDGLAHRNVLSIDVNEANGDVWIGTMNGLNRWSAGVFERFDQFNSGLANNVVYEVSVDTRYTWIATAAGASRFDTYTKQWKIFNEETSPMHEPWTYGITYAGNKAYIAAWGGGVLEYNNDNDTFRVHRDPDGHFQLTLHPDDGLIHDITTGVAFDNGTLWVSTYFGLGRYNGQRWWGYLDHDTGLTSSFINAIKAKNSVAYLATDYGLNTFDGTTWVTYNTINGSDQGETIITNGDTEKKLITDTSISHRFIWNMDAKDDVLWVATSYGLSRGVVVGYVDETIL
jgi:ligand-binding sensor domain-containing protein